MASSSHAVTLEALARTALPAGTRLPSADARTVARAEKLLSHMPGGLRATFSAFVLALDAKALLAYGLRFAALRDAERLAVLEELDRGEATRLMLRALLTPLKMAFFDDPEVYARLGCRFEPERPKGVERPRWRDQLLDGAALAGAEPIDCDVVIVGTGAGGAPLAHALARRGHAVLMLEEGEYHSRLTFDGRAFSALHKLYRRSGATVAFGNTAIPIPIGRGVGGTTLINSGTCFRAPETLLAGWRRDGLQGLEPDALAPFYDEVESFLGVGPSSPAALGKTAHLIARGCNALGFSHHPLRRNAPGCDGQGLCCFGCPTGAKRSTDVSYVPAALGAGAQLLTGVKVERIVTERGAAVGVVGATKGGPLTVRARVVVLACGTLMTPCLLMRNGLANNSKQLGRNLSIHPATAALATFNEGVHASSSVPQGYAIDQFAREGLYFEGASTPLEVTAVSHGGFGREFMALMEEAEKTVTFGFMVKDSSRGRVFPGRDGDPRIAYWLNDADLKKVRRGLGILARVYFAAGARTVHLPVRGHTAVSSIAELEAFETRELAAREVDLTAYHPLGTARMGVDPLRSVVDATHETHDVHNLFVCDGSAVPSSLGVNPQLTIMALSLRAAEHVHRRLERWN